MIRKLIIGVCLLWSLQGLALGHYELLRCSHYTIEDGLPQSFVLDIFQDNEGYLWVCTQDGISKFNGYDFENYYFDPYSSNSLISNYALEISEYADQTLMITTASGISFYQLDEKHFYNVYTYNKNLGTIQSLAKTDNNELYISTSLGVYDIQLTDTITDTIQFQWRQLFDQTAKDLFTYENNLFFVHENIVYKYQEDDVKVWSKFSEKITFSRKIEGGRLLIQHGNNLSLLDFATGKTLSTTNLIGSAKASDALSIDQQIWLATNQGVGVLQVNTQNIFQGISWLKNIRGNVNSISSNNVFSIFRDEFGVIWMGTQKGLDKLDPSKQQFILKQRSALLSQPELSNNCWAFYESETYIFSGYSDGILIEDKKTGVNSHVNTDCYVLSIQKAPRKDLLQRPVYILGTSKGVRWLVQNLNSGEWNVVNVREYPRFRDSLNNSYVFKVHNYRDTLYVAAQNGLYRVDNRKQFTKYNIQNVRDIYVDEKGRKYCISAPTKLHQIIEEKDTSYLKSVEFPKLKQLLPLCIVADTTHVWIGLYGGGMVRYNPKTDKIRHYSTKDGLANNSVYGILKEDERHLWLSTNGGLSKFDKAEEKFLNFNVSDGLQSMEFNSGAFYKSPYGRLFFGGLNGYNIVESDKRIENKIPPKIHIRAVEFEGKNLLFGDERGIDKETGVPLLTLPFWENSLTFKVDGLHFSLPKENIFAYNLIGVQNEWLSQKNKREFYFPNLRPGEYEFNLRVANSDGYWTDEVKTVKIVIQAPFWQTWWFITSASLVVLGIVFWIYMNRLRRIRVQKELLEVKVQERTQEVEAQKSELQRQKNLIEKEKDKEEKLLLNILPQETARELLNTGKASPRSYKKATVMFADFKNFTKIAENLRPEELVEELDDSFAHFDDIVEQFNIEKIKTSGDAYMCVGGVPMSNNTNPVDAVLSALEFQRYINVKRRKREGTGKPQWNLRIGIHTGELVAGVVGKKKFLYDVWGDTVNIAARMETTSDPGKVNISGATYEEIKEYFDCEYRGKLPVKNKGAIDMYYVHRIKPDLSIDAKGIEPNEKFMELLDFNSYSDVSYRKVSTFLIDKLKKELPSNLYYHGPHHTEDVIDAAERIGRSEGLGEEELMMVKLAALFHDAGFLNKYSLNEEEGAKLARKWLPKYNFKPKQVETVANMIMATRVPQNPQNHLEEVLCDADLDYLGRSRDEFEHISRTLQNELLEYNMLETPDQWDPIQIKFLTVHKYFTKTAIQERNVEKMKRLEEIKARVGNLDLEEE